MIPDLLEQITIQKTLSDEVIAVLRPIIQEKYYPNLTLDEIVCGDMSSFSRGTNNGLSPDIDIIFLNAPNDESKGFKDWTAIGTRELTGDKLGITSLDEVEQLDPTLAATITKSKISLLKTVPSQKGPGIILCVLPDSTPKSIRRYS